MRGSKKLLIMKHTHDIIGVGAPVLDSLIQIEDSFLTEYVPGEKGGMELVEAAAIASIIEKSGKTPLDTPGGSTGNTIFAMSRLGMKTAFIGKLGSDAAASTFREAYADMGGDISRFKTADAPNARCLSLITPDSERTMRTMLGASALLAPDEISADDFAGARHVHIEGYLLFNPDLIKQVAKAASQAGCSISLDLASFEVVNAMKPVLADLLENYVDVVFANEDEAGAYFPNLTDYNQMASELAKLCKVAVVKLGADGSIIASGDEQHRVDCRPISQLVDTTGAGDLWASGFLTGWLRGKDLAECGRLGSLMGAEIVQVMGADVPEERWSHILSEFA
jgi:sugar/nucleoside kinase (ribokinase family)